MAHETKDGAQTGSFPTTRWNLVLQVTEGTSENAQIALEELCRAYWYPIYVYVRRKGYQPPDAEDLVQGFFTQLLQQETLHRADEQRGRLRTFLLTDLKHYIADETRRQLAQKRGGGMQFAPLDEAHKEQRYQRTFSTTDTDPEKLYLRAWASTLIETALQRLKEQYQAAGKSTTYDLLHDHLYGKKAGLPYEEIAAQLESSISTARLTVFRLRQKFRTLLESEIAHTVQTTAEIDDEVEFLFTLMDSTTQL